MPRPRSAARAGSLNVVMVVAALPVIVPVVVPDLATNLTALIFGRVHVRVRVAGADRANELFELSGVDALTGGSDDVRGDDRSVHHAPRRRAPALRAAAPPASA